MYWLITAPAKNGLWGTQFTEISKMPVQNAVIRATTTFIITGPSRVYGSLREDSIIIFCHLATRWSTSYRPWIWKYSPYGNFKAYPSRTALFSAGRSHVNRDNLLQHLKLTFTTSHTNPPMSSYFFILGCQYPKSMNMSLTIAISWATRT